MTDATYLVYVEVKSRGSLTLPYPIFGNIIMKMWNKVYKCDEDKFIKLVDSSETFSEILFKLGYKNVSNCFTYLKARMMELDLDLDRFYARIRKRSFGPKKPLEEILVENSSFHRGHLKARLIKEGLLKTECYICSAGTVWNDKPLVLVLDHKNGVNNDNRLKNLRLLCPNCNSQQPTFTGRNIDHGEKGTCTECKREIDRGRSSGLCRQCYDKRVCNKILYRLENNEPLRSQ